MSWLDIMYCAENVHVFTILSTQQFFGFFSIISNQRLQGDRSGIISFDYAQATQFLSMQRKAKGKMSSVYNRVYLLHSTG